MLIYKLAKKINFFPANFMCTQHGSSRVPNCACNQKIKKASHQFVPINEKPKILYTFLARKPFSQGFPGRLHHAAHSYVYNKKKSD
jgi:hypothetical protein